MKTREKEQNQYVIFRIREDQYCIDSRCVAAMIQQPEDGHETAGKIGTAGFFNYRDQVVELFSLRKALNLHTTKQEYNEFAAMIDARKDDHIRWVAELERATAAGERFTLATDPHKCTFGKWYDHFESSNKAVAFQLAKIDEPHKKIHQAAAEVQDCSQQCDLCKRNQCLQKVLTNVKETAMPLILQILDETKEVFSSHVYRDMVLILNGKRHIGLVIDEVLSVEALERADNKGAFRSLYTSSFISDVKKRAYSAELILEINLQELLQHMSDFSHRNNVIPSADAIN